MIESQRKIQKKKNQYRYLVAIQSKVKAFVKIEGNVKVEINNESQ